MRILNSVAAAVIGFAGIIGLGPTAQAIPVYHLDAAAWNAAVSGKVITTETFAAAPQGRLAAGTTDAGLLDITLSNQNRYTTIGAAAFGSLPTSVLNVFLNPVRGVRQMTWSGFDTLGTLYGVAFDVDLLDRSGLKISVNGTDLTIGRATDFIGVVSDNPIWELVITASNEYVELDNIRLASNVAPVPVPPALALFLTALGGLGLLNRKSRRTSI